MWFISYSKEKKIFTNFSEDSAFHNSVNHLWVSVMFQRKPPLKFKAKVSSGFRRKFKNLVDQMLANFIHLCITGLKSRYIFLSPALLKKREKPKILKNYIFSFRLLKDYKIYFLSSQAQTYAWMVKSSHNKKFYKAIPIIMRWT